MAIPKKDAALLAFAQNFSAKINVSPEQWGLTSQLAAEFQGLADEYAADYLAQRDPATKCKSLTTRKDTSKARLLSLGRQLYKIVQGTPSVTDQQRIDVWINVRKAASPIAVPTEAPRVSIMSVRGHRIELGIHDRLVARKGRPPGTAGAMIFSAISDQPPPTIDGWRCEGNFTRTEIFIDIPSDVPPGTKVWFCGCWYNPRGQRGPVSSAIMTGIGFGAAMQFAI